MTDQRPIRTAISQRITTITPALSGSVFGTRAPGDQERYIRVFLRIRHRRDRFTELDRAIDVTVTTHAVGLDDDQASWVQSRVEVALLNHTLLVDGWAFRPFAHTAGDELTTSSDADVLPDRVWNTDQWSTIADPTDPTD